MDSLEKKDYFEHVDFYFNKDGCPSLAGDVYINDDSFCEGIVVDNENNSYFLFGTFRKFDSLNLYVMMNDNQVVVYNGKKVLLRYEGECSLMNGDSLSSFSMKSSSLEVDPREYWGEKTPKEEFLEKLKLFKDNWLMTEKNNQLYVNIFSEHINKNGHK